MDDLDNILTNIDLEEEKLETEEKDWYCEDCEHGPMMDGDTHCTRCGTKAGKNYKQEEQTGWEDEDIESEVEEIW
jgi:uncharacterized paraquat-inducible protein A